MKCYEWDFKVRLHLMQHETPSQIYVERACFFKMRSAVIM